MQVRLYATLRTATGGGRVDVDETHETVGDVLDLLIERFPDLGPLILTAPRVLRPMIAVMFGGRDIRHLNGLETSLAGASAIDIFPPVAGGAEATRTIALRGLSEWLIRDYLLSLGARPDDTDLEAPRLIADAWRVSWTQRPARIAGSVLTLTEFTLVFTGDADTTAEVEQAFLLKAQRGGG